MVETVSNVLGVLTILANLAFLVGLFDLFYYRREHAGGSRVLRFLKTYPLEVVFVFSFVAMISSLFYSDVAGFTPCTLCWYQRIFMYSIAFFSLAARYFEDINFLRYAWVGSLIGAGISLYHYLLQLGVVTFSTCSSIGYGLTCSDRFVLRYGYITIPVMAFSVFVIIALTSYLSYPRKTDALK